MANDAITFLEAKGFERVDLLGFSMGGMIARNRADGAATRAQHDHRGDRGLRVCGFRTSRVTASRSFELPDALDTASLLRPVATTAWPAAKAAFAKSPPSRGQHQ